MTDLVVALGLVLVIEGLLWAVFPALARKMVQAATELPESNLRVSGAVAVAAGVAIVWFIRG